MNVTRTYRETEYFHTFNTISIRKPLPLDSSEDSNEPSTGDTPSKPEPDLVGDADLSGGTSRSQRVRSQSGTGIDDSPLPFDQRRIESTQALSFSPLTNPSAANSRRQISVASNMSGQQQLDPAIQAIVDRAVQTALQAYTASLPPPQRGEKGERGERGQPGESGADAGNIGNTSINRWNAADLGFFDSLYDGKSVVSGASSLEHFGKDSYFRDIHAFIDRAKEMTIIKEPKMVRENLWLSLRGTVMKWWNIELFVNEKRMSRMLKEGHDALGIDEWVTLLHSRFKKSAHVTMNSLTKEKYTIRDAINRREPREYAQKMLRLARDADLTSLKNQLNFIFNGIDLEVRASDIRRFKKNTTLNDFLADIDDVKHDWWAREARNRSQHDIGNKSPPARTEAKAPQQQFGQYFNRQGTFSDYSNSYQNRSNRGFQFFNFQFRSFQPEQQAYSNQYSQQSRQTYEGYQNSQPRFGQQSQPGYSSQNQSGFQSQFSNAFKPSLALPASQPRLQITLGQPNAADRYNFSRQSLKPFDNAGNSNSRYSQKAYQVSVKNFAERDENNEPQEQNTYYGSSELWLDNEASDQEESKHIEKYFGQNVNFVTAANDLFLKHGCIRCNAFFRSRNLLFKHLRQQCWKDTNNIFIASSSLSVSSDSSIPATSNSPPSGNLPLTPASLATSRIASNANIIRSAIKPDAIKENAGYAFRSWHYATDKTRIVAKNDDVTITKKDAAAVVEKKKEKNVCYNSDCSCTLKNRLFIKKQLGENMKIQQLAFPLSMKEVDGKLVKISDFVMIQLFITGTNVVGNSATTTVTVEIHLIDDLKANIFVDVDVLKSQKMILDFEYNTLAIDSCSVTTTINLVSRDKSHTKRIIRSQKAFIVLSGELAKVSVTFHGDLSNDKNFLFEFQCSVYLSQNEDVYAHIVNSDLSFIQIHNITTTPVTLSKRARLKSVVKYNQQKCYQTTVNEAFKAVCDWMFKRTIKNAWKAKLVKAAASLAIAYAVTVGNSPLGASSDKTGLSQLGGFSPPDAGSSKTDLSQPGGFSPLVFNDVSVATGISQIDSALKHICFNGVTVYDSSKTVNFIAALIKEYQNLFVDKDTTINISKKKWMFINLKSGAVAKSAKIYPLDYKNRKVVNQTFDKLHKQNKMRYISQSTPFSYSIFVIWRDTLEERKERTIINIRGLNNIIKFNSYSLFLQSNVIVIVADYFYIFTVDVVGWFYQFNVKRSDRFKFTVVSHCGQKEFSVALINYKSSSPYVQRQTDKMFRFCKHFAKAYVNDIIIHSRSLKEHLVYLRQLFDFFRSKRVSLVASKFYLKYSSIILLGQRVDSLNITTIEKKIAAIISLIFLASLKKLKTFLDLTDWLRSFIERYAQRVNALQKRKTALIYLLSANAKEPSRRRKASKIRFYELTHKKLQSFKNLKNAFRSLTFLTHYNRKRKLFVNLNLSKSWDFADMIYHIKNDFDDDFSRTKVQSIMFFSRCFNETKKNYWSTELKVAGIVWIVRKIRHMIESSECLSTIIYIDHSAAVSISRQTSFTTFSTDKLNLRLIKASQYLSEFNLQVRHKVDKSNIVSNVFFRLQANVTTTKKVDVLKAFYESFVKLCNKNKVTQRPEILTYHIILIKITNDFKNRLQKAYQNKSHWVKILTIIKPKNEKSAIFSNDVSDFLSAIFNDVDNSPPAAEKDSSNEQLFAASVTVDSATKSKADSEITSSRSGLQFKYRNSLIYFTAKNDKKRLCIPTSLKKKVFQLTHDQIYHGDFHKIYDKITLLIYIHQLAKRLRIYIAHCSNCQLNQTKRHSTYNKLTSIITPTILFHTVAINWILALSVTKNGFNVLLTITCKFTKKILLMPDKDTWNTTT